MASSGPRSIAAELAALGRVFRVFDDTARDSGHASYGVESPTGERWFVKTSGRRAALRTAAEVSAAIAHPALLPVERVLEAADGVLLQFPWFAGHVLHCPRALRRDESTAYRRFQLLPAAEIASAMSTVIDLHVGLDLAGWVSGDLYDGSLMYDFDRRETAVIDFEFYRPGPYENTVGRLPGSERFMAPEELERGAWIDGRTTVFNLGRLIEDLLLTEHRWTSVAGVVGRATRPVPEERYASLGELQAAWLVALDPSQGNRRPRHPSY